MSQQALPPPPLNDPASSALLATHRVAHNEHSFHSDHQRVAPMHLAVHQPTAVNAGPPPTESHYEKLHGEQSHLEPSMRNDPSSHMLAGHAQSRLADQTHLPRDGDNYPGAHIIAPDPLRHDDARSPSDDGVPPAHLVPPPSETAAEAHAAGAHHAPSGMGHSSPEHARGAPADGRVAKRARSGPKSAAILGRGASISLARRAAATAKKRREEKRAELERTGLKTLEVADFMEKNPAMRANVSQNRSKRLRRVKWRKHEVEALKKGVERYGIGRWAVILREYAKDFDPVRISVDLKDKWRNIFKAPKVSRQTRESTLPQMCSTPAVESVTAAGSAPMNCEGASSDGAKEQVRHVQQYAGGVEKNHYVRDNLQLGDIQADILTGSGDKGNHNHGSQKHTAHSRDQRTADAQNAPEDEQDSMETDSEACTGEEGVPQSGYASQDHLVSIDVARLDDQPASRDSQTHDGAGNRHISLYVAQHQIQHRVLAQNQGKEASQADIIKSEHIEQHGTTHHIEHRQLIQQQLLLQSDKQLGEQERIELSHDVMHADLSHDANGRGMNRQEDLHVQPSQTLSERAMDEHVMSRDVMSRTGMEDMEQSSMERDDIVQGPLVRNGMMADAVVQDEATGGEMVRDSVMHDMRLPEGEDDMLRQVEQRVEVVFRDKSHQDAAHNGMVSLVDNDFQHMKTGSVLQEHAIELGDAAVDMEMNDDGKMGTSNESQILVQTRAVAVGEDALGFSALV